MRKRFQRFTREGFSTFLLLALTVSVVLPFGCLSFPGLEYTTFADISVNRLSTASPEPLPTPQNLTEEVHAFVKEHCHAVRNSVLNTWLPMGKVDPTTRKRTLHAAFIGDSLSYRQFRFVVTYIDACLRDLRHSRPTVENLGERRAPPEAAASFAIRWRASATVPAAATEVTNPRQYDNEADRAEESTGGRDQTHLVLSYLRVRHAVELRVLLETLYLAQDALAASPSTMPRPRSQGWPSFPALPAPQILYTGVGTYVGCDAPQRHVGRIRPGGRGLVGRAEPVPRGAGTL